MILRELFFIVAVMAAGVVLSAQVSAQDSTPAYASATALVGNRIAKGEDVTTIPGMQKLTAAEQGELAKLEGCSGSLMPKPNPYSVGLDYICAEPRGDVDRRVVRLYFDAEGKIVNYSINPHEDAFAPTQLATSLEKPEKPGQLARKLAQAVKAGDDFTLGGLIRLTDLQKAQLSGLSDLKFRVTSMSTSDTYVISWYDKIGNGGHSVELFFDENDRPVGVLFSNSVIRTQTFKSVRPVY